MHGAGEARKLRSRHPEARAKRASKGDGPAGILRGPRCARAPQDDGVGDRGRNVGVQNNGAPGAGISGGSCNLIQHDE